MNSLIVIKSRPQIFARLFPVFAMTTCLAALASQGSRLDILEFEGASLVGNPLHDPAQRKLAVFVPSQYKSGVRLPVVYYLPGFGGSPKDFISDSNTWNALTQEVADKITPLIIVAVDGRTRWACSQYINSPAQGEYADYICKDIVSCIESRYSTATNGLRRIIAGHSSGGFGALRLGMEYKELFQGVVALSPDSDFPVSHLPLVQLPGVTNATLEQIKLIATEKVPAPRDGDLLYAVALSAAYAPRGRQYPGEFEWLYDGKGHFLEKVWQRWLNNDPLTIVSENPRAFLPDQAVYLDGAAHDQFSANVGARAIYEEIRGRMPRCTFYEPPGGHADHLQQRLERGLAWVIGKPVQEIK